MIKIQNLIGNQLLNPIGNTYIDNIEPATGKVYSLIPQSGKQDLKQAIYHAEEAFPAWSQTSLEYRSDILTKIALGIENRFEEFVQAESRDNGKPISLARAVDIPRAMYNFRYYAHAITQFASQSHEMPGTAINYTLRQPLGLVGCISPWNLPLYLFSWKIAPAIAAGNCVVAKPSEITPFTAYMLSEICIEAGLPSGVLSILHGNGTNIGTEIVAHPKVKAISFTGGTTTGATIAKIASPMFKKLSLELGGKNPNIVFADCNYDQMMKYTIRSSFANQGQICLCGSRILIEDCLYEKFKHDFVSKVSAMQVGDPSLSTTKMGAIVSAQHRDKILSYIELAKKEGGKILAGGCAVQLKGRCQNGYFVEPTVIEGLSQSCRTNQEEIFGPVVTIEPFASEEDMIKKANAVKYGLSAVLWTNNLTRTHKLVSKIDAGIVWVNCWLLRDLRTPFGGVKSSGLGREGGFEALKFFTEAKNVCIKY